MTAALELGARVASQHDAVHLRQAFAQLRQALKGCVQAIRAARAQVGAHELVGYRVGPMPRRCTSAAKSA